MALAASRFASEPEEVIRIVDRALSGSGLSAALRSDALKAKGLACLNLGRRPQALAALAEAITAAQQCGDPSREARCHINLGIVRAGDSEHAAALQAFAAALALSGKVPEIVGIACANIGLIAEELGEFALYLEFECIALDRLPAGAARTGARVNHAVALSQVGRGEEGRTELIEVIRETAGTPQALVHLDARIALAWLDAMAGRFDAALQALTVAQGAARAQGLETSAIKAQALLAEVHYRLGHRDTALRLAQEIAPDIPLVGGSLVAEFAGWLSEAYASAGRFEEAYRLLASSPRVARATISLYEAFDVVRSLLALEPQRSTPGVAPPAPAAVPSVSSVARRLRLTVADLVLLREIATGRTNPEIALVLGVSPNTVRNRLVRICGRLGISGRAAAVARASELGLIDGSAVAFSLRVRSRHAEAPTPNIEPARPFGNGMAASWD